LLGPDAADGARSKGVAHRRFRFAPHLPRNSSRAEKR